MRTIVMTGGTSGIGEVAARQILATPDTRLLLGTRGRGPAGAESQAEIAGNDSVLASSWWPAPRPAPVSNALVRWVPVSVGAACFADPYTPVKVRDGLKELAQAQGLESIAQLTGGVRPW